MKSRKVAIRSITETKRRGPVTERSGRAGLTGGRTYTHGFRPNASLRKTIFVAWDRATKRTATGEALVFQVHRRRPRRGPRQDDRASPSSGLAQPAAAEVIEVATRANQQPWTDDTLIGAARECRDPDRVIAVDAPLTQTACGRCEVPVCPGMEACVDPAVVWLRTDGRT